MVESGSIRVNNQYGTVAKYDSKCRGVSWEEGQKRWHVSLEKNGKQYSKNFRPKDSTDEAREKARLEAIQYRAELEKKHFLFKKTTIAR